jgi:hypothetical protein
MNKLPSLRVLESMNGPETVLKDVAPFVATIRSPADSMQFVALKSFLGCGCRQKARSPHLNSAGNLRILID